ncbi:MAG: hypothetical protein CMC69_01880 [Flavobacteriaceae bacterium]|nr:hypothetical protein [Flavobacteriaceae bacterium]|tara:strand:- start:1654 stop:1854 length:201 start_codon:yes stop_codon:yes gene_type:complete
MIPVEGNKNLFRDQNTGAILNMDSKGYFNYINKKNRKLTEKQEIDNMKKDIDEIKSLLYELVNRKT